MYTYYNCNRFTLAFIMELAFFFYRLHSHDKNSNNDTGTITATKTIFSCMKCCVPQFEHISFSYFVLFLDCPGAADVMNVLFRSFVRLCVYISMHVLFKLSCHIKTPYRTIVYYFSYFSLVRLDCWHCFVWVHIFSLLFI